MITSKKIAQIIIVAIILFSVFTIVCFCLCIYGEHQLRSMRGYGYVDRGNFEYDMKFIFRNGLDQRFILRFSTIHLWHSFTFNKTKTTFYFAFVYKSYGGIALVNNIAIWSPFEDSFIFVHLP